MSEQMRWEWDAYSRRFVKSLRKRWTDPSSVNPPE